MSWNRCKVNNGTLSFLIQIVLELMVWDLQSLWKLLVCEKLKTVKMFRFTIKIISKYCWQCWLTEFFLILLWVTVNRYTSLLGNSGHESYYSKTLIYRGIFFPPNWAEHLTILLYIKRDDIYIYNIIYIFVTIYLTPRH